MPAVLRRSYKNKLMAIERILLTTRIYNLEYTKISVFICKPENRQNQDQIHS